EEKAIYDDLIKDSSNTVAKLRLALGVAAERKDVEQCLALFSKMEKLQPPPKTSAALSQLPTRMASSGLITLMGKLADDKRFADVLKVLDLYLATARKQNLTTVKSASSKGRVQPGSANIALYNVRGMRGNTRVNYPTPNDYFDQGMITILYNAFDFYKKADL